MRIQIAMMTTSVFSASNPGESNEDNGVKFVNNEVVIKLKERGNINFLFILIHIIKNSLKSFRKLWYKCLDIVL